MSVLDNALQALFSMAHKELLWKNASPTSSFAAQNVSVNTSGYDGVMVPFRRAASTDGAVSGTAIIMNYGGGDQVLLGDYAGTNLFRNVIWSSRTQLQFQNAGRLTQYAVSGSTTTENQMLIPVAIYGIKLLGGVIHKLKTLAAPLFGRKEVLA